MCMAFGAGIVYGATAQQHLFVVKTEQDIPYRIPAIATNSDGDLITVVDYRHCRSDIGCIHNGRIDLRARISTDNGKKWQPIFTIVEGQGEQSPDFMHVGFGDPAIVADRESSEVLVISCAGNVSFPAGRRNNHQNMVRFYSHDNGRTWSAPDDMAESIYKQFDNSPIGPAEAIFVASGRILQSRHIKTDRYYRLYCAVLMTGNQGRRVNFVLYSDDFGRSWQVLGGTGIAAIRQGADEAKVEELPDGNIVISSRVMGGRKFNIYTFTEGSTSKGCWGEEAFSGESNGGVTAKGNSCNGEILVVPAQRKADGEKVHLLLQSVPSGPGRSCVGIYYKELTTAADYATPQAIAEKWDGYFPVTTLGSAYSTMCLQDNKRIAFLYEEETFCTYKGGGFTIVYDDYTLEEITQGAYRIGKTKIPEKKKR